ncbi:hypothetical protein D3C85_1397930 [compost metagenome]
MMGLCDLSEVCLEHSSEFHSGRAGANDYIVLVEVLIGNQLFVEMTVKLAHLIECLHAKAVSVHAVNVKMSCYGTDGEDKCIVFV